MRKIYVVAIGLCILTIFGLGCIIYYSGTAPKFTAVNPAVKNISSDSLLSWTGHVLKDFSFTKFDKDKKLFSLSGARLEIKGSKIGIFRFNPKKVAEIQNAQIIFFKDNKPVSKATASRGIYEPVLGKINLLEGVIFETIDRKRQLTSDSFSFNTANNHILSENTCIMTAGEPIVKAKSIRCDIDIEDITVIK